jgi:hypothetical protein
LREDKERDGCTIRSLAQTHRMTAYIYLLHLRLPYRNRVRVGEEIETEEEAESPSGVSRGAMPPAAARPPREGGWLAVDVLKCELWMRSCARGMLDDQLLGFALATVATAASDTGGPTASPTPARGPSRHPWPRTLASAASLAPLPQPSPSLSHVVPVAAVAPLRLRPHKTLLRHVRCCLCTSVCRSQAFSIKAPSSNYSTDRSHWSFFPLFLIFVLHAPLIMLGYLSCILLSVSLLILH